MLKFSIFAPKQLDLFIGTDASNHSQTYEIKVEGNSFRSMTLEIGATVIDKVHNLYEVQQRRVPFDNQIISILISIGGYHMASLSISLVL